MAIRIGELLIMQGKLTEEQLEDALKAQKERHEKVGEALVRLGFVDELTLIKALAQQLKMLRVALDLTPSIPAEVLKHIPGEVARRLRVVPLHLKDGGKVLGVVMTDPSNAAQVDELRQLTGLQVEPMISTPSQILRMIDRCYGVSQDG